MNDTTVSRCNQRIDLLETALANILDLFCDGKATPDADLHAIVCDTAYMAVARDTAAAILAAREVLALPPVICADSPIPSRLYEIGELIRTQDNEYTGNAVFVIEPQRIVTGIDTDYEPEIAWIRDGETIVAGQDEFASLEAAYKADGTIPESYTRTACIRYWDYLTQFFTRTAAEEYVVRNGRKFDGELRISVEGDHRNDEFNFVRDWLATLSRIGGAA